MTLDDAQALRNELGYARADERYKFWQVYDLYSALSGVTDPIK
jgi:hypothetical protein